MVKPPFFCGRPILLGEPSSLVSYFLRSKQNWEGSPKKLDGHKKKIANFGLSNQAIC